MKYKHVAFIMDGNGRWAKSRMHRRVWGHIRGASVVSNIIEESDRLGVEKITLFSFSTENWSRPQEEVTTLFKILKKFLLLEKKRILENKIRFKVIGSIERLPAKTQDLIRETQELSKDHKGLKLNIAFDYGGRSEIVSALNSFMEKNPGKILEEEDLEHFLYENNKTDVDLLIRTGGEQRISNFLLWQSAYAELYFTDTKWPDFTKEEYRKILESVNKRERRFGNVAESKSKIETDLLSFQNKKNWFSQRENNVEK